MHEEKEVVVGKWLRIVKKVSLILYRRRGCREEGGERSERGGKSDGPLNALQCSPM
jgi:hypothetical protein